MEQNRFYIEITSFFFAVGLAITQSANATGPVVNSVSGASAFSSSGTATIYGGMAGDNCADGTTSTCNNCSSLLTCSADDLCACNETRIFSTLYLTISATAATDSTGPLRLEVNDTVLTSTSTSTSLSIQWENLCLASSQTITCESIANKATISAKLFNDNNNNSSKDEDEEATTVYIYIINPGTASWNVYAAVNTEGIGGFTPYPGDEKIFLEDISSTSGYPTLSYGSKATKVRVWISDTGAAAAGPTSTISPEDLNIEDDTGNLENDKVTGLENGTTYFFRVALIDEAGNIVQHFPSAADATASGCDSNPPASTCKWAASPDQVLGLLTEDFNCFVATAAYGTNLDQHLNLFRDFRHRVLLRTSIGKWFVHKYYKYGPMLAQKIRKSETLRGVSRAMLWPMYKFADWSLKLPVTAPFRLGVFATMVLSLPLLLAGFIFLLAQRIRRFYAR